MDLKEIYSGVIEEPIGFTIKYFKVLIIKKEEYSFPLMFWLKTDNSTWHRFFIDAWLPHWDKYSEDEIDGLISEDFEEGLFGGDQYLVKDLMEEFNLKNKTILDAHMNYSEIDDHLCGCLTISLESGITLEIKDYGDDKDSEVILNKKRI